VWRYVPLFHLLEITARSSTSSEACPLQNARLSQAENWGLSINKSRTTASSRIEFALPASSMPMIARPDAITQLPSMRAEVLLFVVTLNERKRLVADLPRVLKCGSPQRDLTPCWRSATLVHRPKRTRSPFLIRSSPNPTPNCNFKSLYIPYSYKPKGRVFHSRWGYRILQCT
jgi:hypothetical protein